MGVVEITGRCFVAASTGIRVLFVIKVDGIAIALDQAFFSSERSYPDIDQ
jgi:hypothetical protein